MTVTVKVPDYSDIVQIATERAVDRAVARVQEQAVTTAPVKSGFYRRKIRADYGSKEVIAEAEYSKAVDYGLPARTIKAKNAKALKFEVGGKTVFAKSVNLPPRAPNPVMRNAARTVQREIPQIFKQELGKIK